MADAISIQELIDARTDAKTLEEAVNGDAVTTVLSRLGESYPTLANALSQIDGKLDSADTQIKQAITDLFQNGGLPATPFATKALMTASALVDGDYAMVIDGGADNGLYIKTAGAWVKSEYDPTTLANTYTDNKVKGVTNNFKTKALMSASGLANDSYAMVTEDTEANNGLYIKTAGAWVKSTYDPVTQAKEYTEGYAVAFKDSLLTIENKNIVTDGLIKNNMYVRNVSGGVTVNGAAGTAVYSLPVSQGTYIIKADGAHNSAVLGMLVDEFGWVAGQVKPIAILQKTIVENTLLVDIPQGIVELVITVKLPSASLDMTSTLQVFRSADPNAQTEVTHIDDKPLADLEARENMALKTDLQDYVANADVQLASENLYSLSDAVAGAYLGSDGVVVNGGTGLDKFYLAVIPVKTGSTYTMRIETPSNILSPAYSTDLDTSNGAVKTRLEFTRQSKGDIRYIDIPELAEEYVYLFLNVKMSAYDISQSFEIIEGWFTDTTPIVGSIAGVKVPSYDKYNPSATSPLAGKGWALIGDSITQWNYRATRNYEQHIKGRVRGLRTYNYAASGTFYASTVGLAETIYSDGHDIDIISVAHGTNDWGIAKVLGTFSPTDTGEDTFANHVHRLLNSLIERFPTKIIVVFTPIPRDVSHGRTGTPNSKGLLVVDYSEMIIKYAKHFGLPVLDLHSMSNLTPWTEEGNWHYFLADKIATEPDGLHPNDAGQKVMADKIQPFLEAQVSQY